MGAEEDKVSATVSGHQHHPQQLDQPLYGTFQGVANYPPPPPVVGFPQPVPPPGLADPPPPSPAYALGYQTVPGYEVAEGRPVRHRRLPCCGLGCGWFLFITGFFLVGFPWLVAALVLVCNRHRMDHREKPGYVACVIAGVVAIIAIVLGVTKGTHAW